MQVGSSETKGKATGAKAAGAKASKRSQRASEAKETLHLKSKPSLTAPTPDELTGMIATAAYFCAEQRRFEPGHELEDWLTAEQRIKAGFSN